jgi:hypothetical protein
MVDRQHPKNVKAVLDWYKERRPDMLDTVSLLFNLHTPPSPLQEAMTTMLLQGFEAGRKFEKEHPEVESGIGYTP